jgi:hypothetical protein
MAKKGAPKDLIAGIRFYIDKIVADGTIGGNMTEFQFLYSYSHV